MSDPTNPAQPTNSMPAHPDRVDDVAAPRKGNTWAGVAIAIVLGGLVLLVVLLHLTGAVGPGPH